MSKMGVSTIASYTGAQIYEALGLATDFVDEYFTGTTSRLEGIGLAEVAREVQARHDVGYQIAGPAPLRVVGAATRGGISPAVVDDARSVRQIDRRVCPRRRQRDVLWRKREIHFHFRRLRSARRRQNSQ